MRTLRRGGAIIGVAVACTAFGAASAGAAVQTFAFTGDEQTFTVPAGVRAVHVVAIGAPGGANPPVAAGGTGDRVEADVAVPPGATQLFVEVGAKGFEGGPSRGFATDSGFNGGGQSCCGAGNGGGASDVRTLPRTDIRTLNSRLLIAGGGGGAGSGSTGRAGGPAGLPNGHHGGGSANETGGAGGFPTEGGQGGFGSDTTGNGQGGTLGQGGDGRPFFR